MLSRLFVVMVIALLGLPAWGADGGATQKAGLRPLQPLIDAAKPNDTIVLKPGTYAGPILIDKPLTLDGQGKATIDAGGTGSVIVLKTQGAVVRNLHLTNSGQLHNNLDAGVQVRGMFNIVEDNVIDNCLFGVDLAKSDYNIVRRNHISSKPFELGMRGDAIRLWYSFNNKVTDNVINKSRDTVVWYSKDNLIARNKATNSRYSLHFMYAQHNKVEDNEYYHNSVGIFLMYSDGIELLNNTVIRSVGTTGMGIGYKETSGVTAIGNKILYCSTGIYSDVSPYQPDSTNVFKNNLIAYSSIGIRFHNDWHGNVFTGNSFEGNITQIGVEGADTAIHNTWKGNYWDDYEGFDRDHNGIGDTPYELYSYADRLWLDVPPVQFFKGSPMLEVLDFLERLAPFSPPSLVLRDKVPMMSPKAKR